MEYLTGNLPQERLSLAIGGVAVAQAALDWTVEYVKDRAVRRPDCRLPEHEVRAGRVRVGTGGRPAVHG